MRKASRFVFILLKNSFFIFALGLAVAWLAKSGSLLEAIFGGIGIYGTIITFNLFILHIALICLTFIFERDHPR